MWKQLIPRTNKRQEKKGHKGSMRPMRRAVGLVLAAALAVTCSFGLPAEPAAAADSAASAAAETAADMGTAADIIAATDLRVSAADESAGGQITVSAAAKGVTVTALPEAGYDLCTIRYKSGGKEVYVGEDAWQKTDRGYQIQINDPAAASSLKARFFNTRVWDGSLDLTWYNSTAKTFHLTNPAQLAGFAAILNGIYNKNISRDMIRGNTAYIVDKVSTIEGGSFYGLNKSTSTFHQGADDFNGKTVYLDCDLDMGGRYDAATGSWTGENNYMPIGGEYLMDITDSGTKLGSSFNGTLDGQGYTIKNIYCNRYNPGANYGDGASVGLIGRLGVHDNDPVSIRAYRPTVRNVIVTGYIYARRSVGGIVGKIGKTQYNNSPSVGPGALIENCANYATIVGTDAKGTAGICAASWNGGLIRNCYNRGTVTSSYAGPCGGITGYNEVSIENCYSTGQVTNTANARYSAAIGSHNGGIYRLKNCYWLSGSAQNGGYYNPPAGSEDQVTEMTTASAMRTSGFVDQLNGDDRAFVADTANTNDGFPVLRIAKTHTADKVKEIRFDGTGLKTDYVVGASINTSGLKIYAIYQDGSKSPVPDYTVSAGGQTYRVEGTYQDGKILLKDKLVGAGGKVTMQVSGSFGGISFSKDFTLKVNTNVSLTDLSVSGFSVRTYAAGQKPDLENTVVTVRYKTASNETESQEVSDYTVKPDVTDKNGAIAYGAQKLVFSYSLNGSKKETELPIRVVSKAPKEEDGTLLLEKAEDLIWFSALVNERGKYTQDAQLMADLDLSDMAYTPAGSGGRDCYAGSFNGNGHTITLKKFISADLATIKNNLALIGYGKNARISKLTVAGTISGTSKCAGIMAQDTGYSTVSDCQNRADISVSAGYGAGITGYVSGPESEYKGNENRGSVTSSGTGIALYGSGGIIGEIGVSAAEAAYHPAVSISGCKNRASVTAATDSAGGILGQVANGKAQISLCENHGSISRKESGAAGSYVGGILGKSSVDNDIWLTSCSNDASISTASYGAGGIAGGGTASSRLRFASCFNKGKVSGQYGVGGIIGLNGYELASCYNTGDITATGTATGATVIGAGGILGRSSQAVKIEGVYSNGKVTGPKGTGGIVGYATNYVSPARAYYQKDGAGQAAQAYKEEYIKGFDGAGLDAAAMKQADFVSKLNGKSSRSFLPDSKKANGGYPILSFQGEDKAQLTGYSLDRLPDKTSYVEGQTFDPEGMVILAMYSDGTAQAVSDYSISNQKPLSKSDTFVTISLTGNDLSWSCQVPITVMEDQVERIQVATPPTRTVYAAGEQFDPTGMEVEAVYLSGKTKKLAKTEYVSQTGALAADDIWVTIKYTGSQAGAGLKEATWNVRVVADSFPEKQEGIYQIGSDGQLELFAALVNERGEEKARAVLTADLTAGETFVPIGHSQEKPFAGSLDGAGHSIKMKNLFSFEPVFGLIAYGGSGAGMKDLTITGSLEGSGACGALVGYGDGVSITGCVNKAEVAGQENVGGLAGTLIGKSRVEDSQNQGKISASKGSLGGIVGYVGDSTIVNCANHQAISAFYQEKVGGIAGYAGVVTISGCSNDADIKCGAYSGGILGDSAAGTVSLTDCHNSGQLAAGSNKAVGGIVGRAKGSLKAVSCTNTGSIAAGDCAGGIGGIIYGTVKDGSNQGNVTSTGNGVGGIAGALYGSLTACVSKAELSGLSQAGGLAGWIYYGALTDCTASGTVKTSSKETQAGKGLGGLVGNSQVPEGLVLSGCSFTGKLDASGNGKMAVGGLVGYAASPVNAGTSSYTITDGADPGPIGFLLGEGTTGKSQKVSLKGAKLTLKKASMPVTGSARKPGVKKLTLKGKTLKEGRDYTVSYKNNKAVGTGTVIVKGKGNYEGTLKKQFQIVPKTPALASLTAAKKGFLAKWKKPGGKVTGLQIQYATGKSFQTGKKTLTIKSTKTTKKKIGKLKAKKTYYVRIRTFQTVKGKKYYSAWSKAKKIRTK